MQDSKIQKKKKIRKLLARCLIAATRMCFTVKQFLVAVPVTKKLDERPTDPAVPFTKFALPGVGSTWIR